MVTKELLNDLGFVQVTGTEDIMVDNECLFYVHFNSEASDREITCDFAAEEGSRRQFFTLYLRKIREDVMDSAEVTFPAIRI